MKIQLLIELSLLRRVLTILCYYPEHSCIACTPVVILVNCVTLSLGCVTLSLGCVTLSLTKGDCRPACPLKCEMHHVRQAALPAVVKTRGRVTLSLGCVTLSLGCVTLSLTKGDCRPACPLKCEMHHGRQAGILSIIPH